MRMTHGRTRLVLVAALAVFAFAAVASSAMAAVSIEPFSTKFTGETPAGAKALFNIEVSGITQISWSCNKNTLTGTTNATKTNYINATDTFGNNSLHSCPFTLGVTNQMTYSNHCATEGTAPWTVTFNEGGTTSLKLNCALVMYLAAAECTITAPEQTLTSGPNWSNVKSVNLELSNKAMTFSGVTFSSGCTEIGIGGKGAKLSFTDPLLINGIHAA